MQNFGLGWEKEKSQSVQLDPSFSRAQADTSMAFPSPLLLSPDDRHNALLHSVSGLFCASLGQALTNSFTTRPYIPHLTSPLGSSSCFSLLPPPIAVHLSELILSFHLYSYHSDPSPYHSTSPPSSLCTENLTPFLKLLPSKGRSGISALLKSHRVFEGNWHSMSVKVRREEDGGIRTELGFEVIWDLVGRKKVGGLTSESSSFGSTSRVEN